MPDFHSGALPSDSVTYERHKTGRDEHFYLNFASLTVFYNTFQGSTLNMTLVKASCDEGKPPIFTHGGKGIRPSTMKTILLYLF